MQRTHVAKGGHGLATLEELAVVGDKEATLSAAQHFVLVKAEGCHITHGARAAPPVGGAMGLAGIFDHGQAMPPRNLHNRVHVATDAPVVDNEDRPGARRDSRFNAGGIEVHGRPVHIHKYRHRAVVNDRRGAARPGERRGDHLVPCLHAARRHAHVQGRGAAVGSHAIGVAIPGGKLLLQELHVRTIGVLILPQ